MAIKKYEIYNSLWASCDELRGRIMPEMTTEVGTLEKKVHTHLKKMGFIWK